MTLRLIDGSDNTWRTFCSWFKRRNEPSPQRPSHGIWVEGPYAPKVRSLIAGLCLYPSEGPWVIVEHVATHPDATPEARHVALEVMVAALKSYGAFTGKALLCFPRHQEIEERLARAGFVHSKAKLMLHAPSVDTGVEVTAPGTSGGGAPPGPLEGTPDGVNLRPSVGPGK